jgi:hypothetical protein
MNRHPDYIIAKVAEMTGQTHDEVRQMKGVRVQRILWAADGLCRYCGDPSAPGMTALCEDHARLDRMAKIAKRIREGKPVRESTRAAGGVRTVERIPKSAEMAVAMGVPEEELKGLTYGARRYRWLRHRGYCGFCYSAPLDGFSVCQKHWDMHNVP